MEVEAERFRVRPVDLSAVLQRAAQAWGAAGGVRSRIGDREQALLVRALHALIETALKFSSPGETVRLSGDAAPDSTRICIASQSGAIPAPVLFKFFDLLAVAGTSTSGGDLGLGPPLASRIVAMFSGSESVENRNPSGVRFVVSLRRALEGSGSDSLK